MTSSVFPFASVHRSVRLTVALALLCTSLLLAGCDRTGSAGSPNPPLQTMPLQVGLARLEAELAMDRMERQRGLMHRPTLDQNRGMLFVFPTPQPMGFWMKNTVVPLSIAYIDREGVIREIHDMEPFSESTARSSRSDLLFALEVNRGWFGRNGVGVGDRISPADGSSLADLAGRAR